MRFAALATLLLLPCLQGCSDDSGPTQLDTMLTEGPALSASQVPASTRWMEVTRSILGRREGGSPNATARVFALVAVAQYNAATAAGLTAVASAAGRPSEAAAVSAASAAVLAALYPLEQDSITARVTADRAYFPTFTSQQNYDITAGETIGRTIAATVLARAASDGATLVWTGTIPVGAGYWVNTAPIPPVLPRWGEAKPWFMSSGTQFRVGVPPVVGSTEFQAALAEVKAITVARTADQLTIAQFWQGASGPAGPMGYFTSLASGYAADGQFNERRAARVYAMLHMAMMDATIGCWDSKYQFWYVRPHQADPGITTPVGRPNFPAYPSAHSCVSSAAAAVLGGLFVAQAASLNAKVAEAGIARMYAGLHFRFDITAGQELGGRVGALALTKVPAANTPIPLQ